MTTRLREKIVDQLKTIANSEEQLRYERNVPIANVPSELICQWYYFSRWPEDEYQSSFSTDERNAIASFHAFFEKRVDRLPQNDGVEGLQKSPKWQQIQERARATLLALGYAKKSS